MENYWIGILVSCIVLLPLGTWLFGQPVSYKQGKGVLRHTIGILMALVGIVAMLSTVNYPKSTVDIALWTLLSIMAIILAAASWVGVRKRLQAEATQVEK